MIQRHKAFQDCPIPDRRELRKSTKTATGLNAVAHAIFDHSTPGHAEHPTAGCHRQR